MAAKKISVICLEDRQIGNDLYVAGNKYKIAAERADRYSAYFKVVQEPVKPKRAKKVQTKDAGATEDK